MYQETNIVEFRLFNADLKKMSDAELEASLKELRELTMIKKPTHLQPALRQRAA